MKKLWTFGDSFTEDYKEFHGWSKKYIEFKGYVPKNYTEILAEMLDAEYENNGHGGFDNYSIFDTICENSERFNPGDIVVINWSDTLRFRLAGDDNQWAPFVPSTINFDDVPTTNISKRTFEEIIVNREHYLYQMEINNWIKLLNSLMRGKFYIVHWTPFDLKYIDAHSFMIGETIFKETKGEIIDYHYNERGQVLLAGYLFGILNNPNKLI